MHPCIKQYIDLYQAERHTIDAHSSAAINRMRSEALQVLSALSDQLPDELTEPLSPDYGVNITRMPLTADAAASFRCSVPGLTAHTAVCAGDIYSFPSPDTLPDGVTFCSLREMADREPDFIEQLYGSIAPIGDTTVALNTLLAQDGVLIHVARGVKADCLLQVVNIFGAPLDMLAPRRVLVVMEDDSAIRLLMCDHASRNDYSYLSLQVTEAILGVNARLELFDIEDSLTSCSRLSGLYSRQQQGSALVCTSMSLNGGRSTNRIETLLDASRTSNELRGMVIADGHRKVTHRTLVRHEAPDCTSDQLYKYVLDQQAVGRFDGLVRVAEGASGTKAFQSNRNLVADPAARMYTQPQLEIYCDDVKCSHGSSTGRPDDEAMFYMQTRGIPADEARRMLMQAFMADILDGVRPEALRDRLSKMVESRFEKSRPDEPHSREACGVCRAASDCRLLNDQ